jgi:hypothetical protein
MMLSSLAICTRHGHPMACILYTTFICPVPSRNIAICFVSLYKMAAAIALLPLLQSLLWANVLNHMQISPLRLS